MIERSSKSGLNQVRQQFNRISINFKDRFRVTVLSESSITIPTLITLFLSTMTPFFKYVLSLEPERLSGIFVKFFYKDFTGNILGVIIF